MSVEYIDVVAGLVFDEAGRVLIAQRLPGTHMAGTWEFPGGKLERGESQLEGLRRELGEELGIAISAAEPFTELTHDYPEKSVRLFVWHVQSFDGNPRGLDGQALRWVCPEKLGEAGLIEADIVLVGAVSDRFGRR